MVTITKENFLVRVASRIGYQPGLNFSVLLSKEQSVSDARMAEEVAEEIALTILRRILSQLKAIEEKEVEHLSSATRDAFGSLGLQEGVLDEALEEALATTLTSRAVKAIRQLIEEQ